MALSESRTDSELMDPDIQPFFRVPNFLDMTLGTQKKVECEGLGGDESPGGSMGFRA